MNPWGLALCGNMVERDFRIGFLARFQDIFTFKAGKSAVQYFKSFDLHYLRVKLHAKLMFAAFNMTLVLMTQTGDVSKDSGII